MCKSPFVHLVSHGSSVLMRAINSGTGASAIYPLLACRTLCPPHPSSSSSSPSFQMLATDIDAHSLSFAEKNVFENSLLGQVSLFHVEQQGRIFPPEVVESVETCALSSLEAKQADYPLDFEEDSIDFTMCNPPFYASQDEIAASLAAKELEPFAVCTGASNEMLTPGGEVAFVSRMIDESLSLGSTKIRWFTSLLGKFSSISPLVDLLKSHHGQTTRWILTWSLQDRRIPSNKQTLLPSPPDPALARFAAPTQGLHTYIVPSASSVEPRAKTQEEDVVARVADAEGAATSYTYELEQVRGVLEGGEGAGDEDTEQEQEQEKEEEEEEEEGSGPPRKRRKKNEHPRPERDESATVYVAAWRNCWSRSARRAASRRSTDVDPLSRSPREREGEGEGEGRQQRPPPLPYLEARISLSLVASPSPAPAPPPTTPAGGELQIRLEAEWTRGLDRSSARQDFTGLWGFLIRKVAEGMKRRGTALEEREGERRGKV
ncbi:SPOSA6832_04516 [Sporobolomyces salmonicolor]|uniref:SPOSA6832_04516-mRNA-1:cds n=1 Tax=Sporidiobolus salmonicolor TaxID=5005 RepID=A0A0D6ESZ6_SPOSA|nr:SPOSA6832_04516 [Sporobolomyces salmonicolor]